MNTQEVESSEEFDLEFDLMDKIVTALIIIIFTIASFLDPLGLEFFENFRLNRYASYVYAGLGIITLVLYVLVKLVIRDKLGHFDEEKSVDAN